MLERDFEENSGPSFQHPDADRRSTSYCEPAKFRLHPEGKLPWPPYRREKGFIHGECFLRIPDRQDSRSMVGDRQGGYRSSALAANIVAFRRREETVLLRIRRLPLVSNFLLRVAAI